MKIKEKYARWFGIPALAFLLPLIINIRDDGETYLQASTIALLYCFTFWQGNCYILFALRKVFPSYKDTNRRIAYTIFFASIYTILAGIIINNILYQFDLVTISCIDPSYSRFYEKMQMNMAITGMVGTIYESTYFFNRWKKAIIEAEQLKIQHIRSQFEVLKNQVSPHFLFNSLNTLISIIPETPDLAVEFTEKLSKVYRYILQNKDKELVELEQELIFTKSYIFLLKIRFGENLKINYKVKDEFLQHLVAPLTLQMLVENAIKHNIISKAKPLTIDIYVENGNSITVRNNLQIKNVVRQSTKVGLENIIKRYKYLSNQAVDVISTTGNFIVSLPLIKLSDS